MGQFESAPGEWRITGPSEDYRLRLPSLVITMVEIRFGLEVMADGRRKLARVKAFNRLIDEKLERRIASFDAAAAQETAILMSSRPRRGEPRDLRESMIAGIALARRAALATHNVKHFDDVGIEVVNPSHG